MYRPPAVSSRVALSGEARPVPCGLGSIAVLIPAWQPEPYLLVLVAELLRAGIGRIVVVDDGSGPDCQGPFAALRELDGVTVLQHAANLGKGRALKTGLGHLHLSSPAVSGVVTADADGQHTAVDIVRVAEALLVSGPRPVLGVRTFGATVPFRSRAGNLFTRPLFALLTGTVLRDTQTGLRGLPTSVLPLLLMLPGERYDYEMTVLAYLCRGGPPPIQLPIATVYLDHNQSSHFHPVWDSLRIYLVLFRLSSSALLAAAVNFVGFSVCFVWSRRLLLSVLVGWVGSLVTLAADRRSLVRGDVSSPGALWRSSLFAAAMATGSYGLIFTLYHYGHWNVFLAKIVSDVSLRLISFAALGAFVSRRAAYRHTSSRRETLTSPRTPGPGSDEA